jgi:hypothetical protein
MTTAVLSNSLANTTTHNKGCRDPTELPMVSKLLLVSSILFLSTPLP